MSESPLLLLRLEGTLQAWGLRAKWDVRDSGAEPSKSAIIGLLGCALGFGRGDCRLAELEAQLSLGVRVEHPGLGMVDYQTITGTLPTANGETKGTLEDPATIISPRAYLQDAAFLCALAGPCDVLQRCAEALAAPCWPYYLGRRSCPPVRPVFEALTTDYDSVEEALRAYPWAWEGHTRDEAPPRLRCLVEDPAGPLVRPDRLSDNPARMYQDRRLRELWVEVPRASKEVTACTSR